MFYTTPWPVLEQSVGLLERSPAADTFLLKSIACIDCIILTAEAAETGAVHLGAVLGEGDRKWLGGTQYIAALILRILKQVARGILVWRCTDLDHPTSACRWC